jgi:phosphoenolpyruvate carboxykinase (diphosphate)
MKEHLHTHKIPEYLLQGSRIDLKTAIGLDAEQEKKEANFIEFINIKLTAMGYPIFGKEEDFPTLKMNHALLAAYQEKSRILAEHLCPADQRIQNFIDEFLDNLPEISPPKLPARTFVLDYHGLARTLSFSPDSDKMESALVHSYRIKQGVLHNPRKDRRTTQGVFHIVEEGFPVPADKKSVTKIAFARMLQAALNPPQELLQLPFKKEANLFVSLLLRPVVCPEVLGVCTEKSMEIRFFTPGSLVSNLDFVESIFGNAGNPALVENDASLDVEHWTGHSGCIILAPHLTKLTKKSLGLPHVNDATERQKQDDMCWCSEDELYNNGKPFKITARDQRGVIITLLADNYFGYCKKEVKTQISYAANLYGNCEEEHAGGALLFPSYDLGEKFQLKEYNPKVSHTFDEVIKNYGYLIDLQEKGYGIDKNWSDIIYLPDNVEIQLNKQKITWQNQDGKHSLTLQPKKTYILPSGYKVEMTKCLESGYWKIIGTQADATFCHKPCTVSGGGKSEISKSIADAIIHGPVFVKDFEKDFDLIESILCKDYRDRFAQKIQKSTESRSILSALRSIGSVIKLITPSDEYTQEYNAWLETIPYYIKELVLVVKRFSHKNGLSTKDWRQHFQVDIINGTFGHELKYYDQKLVAQYLRVGYTKEASWRVFSLRQDFNPSLKIQMEDDITASVIIPAQKVKGLNPKYENKAVKFTQNCEYRFFQRPDDAITRGYDKQTEKDLSTHGNLVSNYEPLTHKHADQMIEDAIHFDQFTALMQNFIRTFAHEKGRRSNYFITPANPRIINGQPSKNPRYLQTRPDLFALRKRYIANLGARFYRRIPLGNPVPFPVNAVLPGRRNNPAEPGIRPLSVYNPIHYLELPELFMEFIASMTGKSPSTTGAGSEGALTKGPFNALLPIIDLNNALCSYIVTTYQCFITAAGYIGAKYKVAHDLSLLIPEVWSRMKVQERQVQHLIENGFLEKCEDFKYKGRTVLFSRLGYRITKRFQKTYLGRIFNNPELVFPKDMLKPELQDKQEFIDGIDNIVETHKQVANNYFKDQSIEFACPPLNALLHIMAFGHYKNKQLQDPEIQNLFNPEIILASSWYQKRLLTRQKVEIKLLQKNIHDMKSFLAKPVYREEADRLHIQSRLQRTKQQLIKVQQPEYLQSLEGTLGADPAIQEHGAVL